METLTTIANEGGSYFVTGAFTDEDDASVIPTSLFWSLTDSKGNTINSQENIEISTPAASVTVVLSGDDLVMPETRPGVLEIFVFTFTGTYDSTLGSDLPFRESVRFKNENLAVT